MMLLPLLLLLSFPAAPLRAEGFNISAKAEKDTLRVTAIPPAGFHVNEDYQSAIVRLNPRLAYAPTEVSASRVEFELLSSDDQDLHVSLGFCNEIGCRIDARTWRWKHEAGVLEAAGALGGGGIAPSRKGARVDKNGFIVDDLTAASALAKAQNRPLLVHFETRWCWICDLLEDEVFPTEAYRSATRPFVKVRLDGDNLANGQTVKDANLVYYPLSVFMTPALEEFGRSEGYHSAENEVAIIRSALERQALSLPRAQKIAMSGEIEAAGGVTPEEAADRAAELLVGRHEFKSALQYLKLGSGKKEALRLEAEVGAAMTSDGSWDGFTLPRDKSQVAQFAALQERRIQSDPLSANSIVYRYLLGMAYDHLGEPAKRDKILTELIEVGARQFGATNWFIGEGTWCADINEFMGDAYVLMGKPQEARAEYLKTVKKFEDKMKTAGPRARQGMLNRLAGGILLNIGDADRANDIFTKLQREEPARAAFYYEHVKFLLGLAGTDSYAKDSVKKSELYAKAIQVAEAGLSRSTDPSPERLVKCLAQAWAASGNKQKAVEVLTVQLKNPRLAGSQRLKTYLASLQAKR